MEVKLNEEKAKLLAEKRVNKALNAIRLVGNLGRHPLDAADKKKIVKVLKNATSMVEAQLQATETQKDAEFKL